MDHFNTNINTNNINMEQIYMMAVIPMISSLLATMTQSIVSDLKNIIYKIISTLYNFLKKYANKYLLKKYDSPNELILTLATGEDHYSSVTSEVMPIIWYLNTTTMLKSNKLRTAKIYGNLMNHASSINTGQVFFVPTLNKNNQNNDANFSKQETDSNKSLVGNIVESYKQMTDIEIEPGIFIEFREDNTMNTEYTMTSSSLVLKSETKSLAEIGKFYVDIKQRYETEALNKKGKLYIYNGLHENPQYSVHDLDTSQTFNNIFLKNKKEIVDEVLQLADADYYKGVGIKRKLGYLCVGPPGSGKTSLVTTIANLTGRSIVYIPISRIQHNHELDKIIYDKTYNGVKYKFDEIIFSIDEMDSMEASQSLKKTKNTDKEGSKNTDTEEKQQPTIPNIIIQTSENNKNKNYSGKSYDKNFDKLNVGMFLNILDGNSDQSGMIIVGTANDITKLDPAIYRNGRMQLVNFEYLGRDEICEMIEYYYKISLTDEQKQKIRNDKTVQSLTLKNVCLKYVQKKKQKDIDINHLIDEINYLFDNLDQANVSCEKLVCKYNSTNHNNDFNHDDDYDDYDDNYDEEYNDDY